MSPLAAASLWAGVVAIGLYHGLNPAMGWPLAVANGLERQRGAAVFATWLPLGAGHLLAMALVLLPFALLANLLPWGREIRIGVGLLVLVFGAWRLVRPGRHRWSRRLRPTQLTLWSFLMASAHGAGLMLLPLLVGATDGAARPHAHATHLMAASLVPGLPGPGPVALGLQATALHTAGYLLVTGFVALLVYRKLGLRMLRTMWINLDLIWGGALVVTGVVALLA